MSRASWWVGLAFVFALGCGDSSGEGSEDGATDFGDAEVLPESADDVLDDGAPEGEGEGGGEVTDVSEDSDLSEVVDIADIVDGSDTTCECETAADCDDGEACNGLEQCVACRCVPGTPSTDGTTCDDDDVCTVNDACREGVCTGEPKDCSDGNPCTFDRCNATTGLCENPFAPPGSACDDGDACTVSEVCQFGRCRGECLPACSWWPDNDGDGSGDASAEPVCAATAPPRHANGSGDCCDSNPLVYPGQTSYFRTAYECGSGSSWDYDCNGRADRRWNLYGECDMTMSGCELIQEGWLGDIMPCGVTGPFITGCSTSTGVCSWGPTTPMQQMCR